MAPSPALGPRSIHLYACLCKDLAAFNYVLRVSKPAGPCTGHTIETLNGMYAQANRLFQHHRDLPHFAPIPLGDKLSLVDIGIIVARLSAACQSFEERHGELDPEARRRAETERFLKAFSDRPAPDWP